MLAHSEKQKKSATLKIVTGHCYLEVSGLCQSQAQALVVAVECQSSNSGRAYPCVAAISGDTPDCFTVTARYFKNVVLYRYGKVRTVSFQLRTLAHKR